jgi:hypothetical protein
VAKDPVGDEQEDVPFRDDAYDDRGGRSRSGSVPPPEPDRNEGERKRLFERAVPEILKRVVERAVESGASRIAEGPENLRQFVHDLKLPKEALHYLYNQVDDTKNGLYRVVAKEVRDFLEHTHFADELTKVLTKLSFEIKTEIRFIPNEAGKPAERGAAKRDGEKETDEPEGAGRFPKPEVSAQVSVKDRSKDARR